MGITFENLPRDYEQLQVPAFILKGHSSAHSDGLIVVESDKYSPQCFEVYNGFFKLFLNLDYGINTLTIKHMDGTIGNNGYPIPNYKKIYDEIKAKVNYTPTQDDNLVPKIHLCVMVGKDSPMLYDCPEDKMFEGNGIQTAVKKMRVGARIMQGFTVDEMSKNGLGRRSFRFVEERSLATSSYQLEARGVEREEVKIHIIKSDRTVKEIRDANYAQQNKDAKEAGKLFGFSLDALKNSGGAFSDSATNSTPALAAVLILDAHWDQKQNLILGHAALGGGTDRIKLAIFGSQGLHSWPIYWEGVQRAFTDCTRLNVDEVANDCNECGSYWEALTVSLGAFMHEIGHSLGCPHQENGVMLRDYITMNRKFIPRERFCSRTKRDAWGPVGTKDEPGWHRLDLMRFLYHPAFALPSDFNDAGFRPPQFRVNQSMKLPNGIDGGPNFTAIDAKNLQITSDTGIYLIECHVGEWSRLHYEYTPKFYNGLGSQKLVNLNYDVLESQIDPKWRGKPIKIEVLCAGFCQHSIDDLAKFLQEHSRGIPGYRGNIVRKSEPLGGDDGHDVIVHFSPDKRVNMIRVTHGMALDGLQVYFDDNSYVDLGTPKSHYTDFVLAHDEYIIGVNLRSGAWIDGIQFVTNKRVGPHYGGTGGSLHKLRVPQGMKLLGFYGKLGGWLNQLGILYG